MNLSFPDELVISMTLALSEKMPKITSSVENSEIKRLEILGEALIEHLYLVNSITHPSKWNLAYNDIENARIS